VHSLVDAFAVPHDGDLQEGRARCHVAREFDFGQNSQIQGTDETCVAYVRTRYRMQKAAKMHCECFEECAATREGGRRPYKTVYSHALLATLQSRASLSGQAVCQRSLRNKFKCTGLSGEGGAMEVAS
jgi:hypothetical protein